MRTSTAPARTAAVAPPTVHPDAFQMSGGPTTASVAPLAFPGFRAIPGPSSCALSRRSAPSDG